MNSIPFKTAWRWAALLCCLGLSGCSWFGGPKCLDDEGGCDPQENAAASQRPAVLFWYCYGAARDQPWDCSNVRDDGKIRIIPDALPDEDDTLIAVTLPADAAPSPIPEAANFVVQLIALETVSAVEAFALEHEMEEPVYFKVRGPDGPLYALLLGYYASRPEAQQAAEDWEAAHNADEPPFVRSVEALEAAIIRDREADAETAMRGADAETAMAAGAETAMGKADAETAMEKADAETAMAAGADAAEEAATESAMKSAETP